MAIAPGTVGPGGAKFGAGAGGPNRFDFTQYGGGLWSIGIDPNSPTVKQDVQRWYDSQPAAVKAEVQKGMGNQPGRGSIDPLVYAADWRGRDVARKIQKSNKFLDTTLGKVLGTVATIGAGFLPGGQVLAPMVGAGIGGAQGGLKGAVLGGLSGYGAGQGAQFLKGAAAKAGGAAAFKAAPGAFAKNVAGQTATAAKNAVLSPVKALTGGGKVAAQRALDATAAAPGAAPEALRGGLTAAAGAGTRAAGGALPAIAPVAPATGLARVGAGLTGLAGRAVDALLENPLTAGSLGLAAYQAIKGPQPTTAEKTVTAQNAQTNALTQQLTQRYMGGQLDPSDERAIEEWRRGSRAQVEQFFANAGIPDSTQKIEMLRDIDVKAVSMRDQVRQNYASAAMSGANVSSNAAAALAQLQQLGDQEASRSLQNLMYLAASAAPARAAA
jgi:hypothetical protein